MAPRAPAVPTQMGCPPSAQPGSWGGRSGTTPSLHTILYFWHRMSASAGTGECGSEREPAGACGSIPGSGWQTHTGADAVSVGNVSNGNL